MWKIQCNIELYWYQHYKAKLVASGRVGAELYLSCLSSFDSFTKVCWSSWMEVVEVQGAYRSWKVMKIKIQIFQAWKVVESGLGHGKSWKINHTVAAFWPIVFVFWPWTAYWPNRNNSARLTYSSVYVQLSSETCHRCIQKVINEHMWLVRYPFHKNSTGKTWKMNINGHRKSWKMHMKKSCEKVLESHGKPLLLFCVHPVNRSHYPVFIVWKCSPRIFIQDSDLMTLLLMQEQSWTLSKRSVFTIFFLLCILH